MLLRFDENVIIEDDEELTASMNRIRDNLEKYVPGDYLMTDDKAPVELLGMRVIDEIISDEVTYYRQVFKEQGLEGLLGN